MISIIIPVLNEEKAISALMQHLCYKNPNCEVIIVDGGSSDRTVEICSQFKKVKLAISEKGRANQMNKGAEIAKGDILLFLHADTHLPEDGIAAINTVMLDKEVLGGSFYMKFDDDSLPFRFFSTFTKINSSYFTYGDQAIFIRKDVFKEIGAYKAIPIFEDFEIQKRLRKKGKFVKLHLAVTTSARRFVKNGIIKQQLFNIALLCAYEMGCSPAKLKKYYADTNR